MNEYCTTAVACLFRENHLNTEQVQNNSYKTMMNTFLSELLRERECVTPTTVVLVHDNARIRFNASRCNHERQVPSNRIRVRQRGESSENIMDFHLSRRWTDPTPKNVDMGPILPARCHDRPLGETTITTTTRGKQNDEESWSVVDDDDDGVDDYSIENTDPNKVIHDTHRSNGLVVINLQGQIFYQTMASSGALPMIRSKRPSRHPKMSTRRMSCFW